MFSTEGVKLSHQALNILQRTLFLQELSSGAPQQGKGKVGHPIFIYYCCACVHTHVGVCDGTCVESRGKPCGVASLLYSVVLEIELSLHFGTKGLYH